MLPSSRSRSLIALAAAGTALAGCGAGARAATATATTTAGASCAATVSSELASIAGRIYGQAAHGRDVVGAVARVERSTRLAAAVARDDPAATQAALKPLLRADIRRITITRRGHVLASFGSSAALGPVHGTIRDAGSPVGSFTLASGTDSGVAGLIQQLTGAQVVIRAGKRQIFSTLPDGAPPPSADATTSSLRAEAFPSGSLGIEVRTGRPNAALCGSSTAATRVNTIGAVGERLFRSETEGPSTHNVLHTVANDPRFIRAVADSDPAAVRAQIVRFFQDPHLHVVRIRARSASGALINDVGGPYVISPASAPVLLHGRRVGTVTLSIQDDTGYIKLMNRFTGADVVLGAPSGEIPGSTLPVGGAALPAHGATDLHGQRYKVFSFNATAFPSGPLRVSLLVPTD